MKYDILQNLTSHDTYIFPPRKYHLLTSPSKHITQVGHNACDNLCKCQEKDNKVVYTMDGWKESALLGIEV